MLVTIAKKWNIPDITSHKSQAQILSTFSCCNRKSHDAMFAQVLSRHLGYKVCVVKAYTRLDSTILLLLFNRYCCKNLSNGCELKCFEPFGQWGSPSG